MKTPYTDDNGYDHVIKAHYCADCGELLTVRESVAKDHSLMVWRHYGIIAYREVLATDEKGFTLEGVVAQPARNVLAPIPLQTRVQWCTDCLPALRDEGCAYCGVPVDLNLEHSELEVLDKKTNGWNGNLRTYIFHHDCLPSVFDKVREYRENYR